MENPCKIVTFGDSITKGYTPYFERRLLTEYSDHETIVINEGVVSDTSSMGLARVQEIVGHNPDVVIVGFGMNDWRKGGTREQFLVNMGEIIDTLNANGIRVLLLTLNPDWQGEGKGTSSIIARYNEDIRNMAVDKRIRIVDVYALWQQKIKPIHAGLIDEIHPNQRGHEIFAELLMRVVPRVSTTAVWQYNGYHAFCNYACPYCYYPTKTHFFRHTIEQWHDGFLDLFGRQRVTFYLSYGEPMLGKVFYEVLDMIASEPQWDAIITTNLSTHLDRLLKTKLVKDSRLEINASFHPTQKVSLQDFLAKLLILREHGIEAPVVYVMYPEQIRSFSQYFQVFDRNGFFVHVRRFRGRYKNRIYPQAYTNEERFIVARYMDKTSLTEMLNNRISYGRLSYAGMFYIVVNNDGDVGVSPEYPDYGKRGNIIHKTAKLDPEPQPYPGHISEGSVDGTASLLDTCLKELTGNHIWSYATQSGVRKENGKILYPLLSADLNDPRLGQHLASSDLLFRMYHGLMNRFRSASQRG